VGLAREFSTENLSALRIGAGFSGHSFNSFPACSSGTHVFRAELTEINGRTFLGPVNNITEMLSKAHQQSNGKNAGTWAEQRISGTIQETYRNILF
jgi:hypothetical protein